MTTSDAINAETFAAGLPARLLHCRELGHVWAPLDVSWDSSARCFERALRCKSCRTIRRQLLDSSGHVLRNGYDYVAGYLAGDKLQRGTYSRDVFRLEAVNRFLEQHNERHREREAS